MDVALTMVGIALFLGFFAPIGVLMFLEWNRWRKHAREIQSRCRPVVGGERK